METKDKNKLYQIRGDTEFTATASQVEAVCIFAFVHHDANPR